MSGTSIPNTSSTPAQLSLNYATAGEASKPALLLVPGQTESWWGYEAAMELLQDRFQLFAGSTLERPGPIRSDAGTLYPRQYGQRPGAAHPGRDRPTDHRQRVVVRRGPVGLASAYAPPGFVRAAHYEDPPLFASETNPAYGHSIRQAIGPIVRGCGQNTLATSGAWAIGPAWPPKCGERAAAVDGGLRPAAEPPQNLKEYDPPSGDARFGPEPSRRVATMRGC